MKFTDPETEMAVSNNFFVILADVKKETRSPNVEIRFF